MKMLQTYVSPGFLSGLTYLKKLDSIYLQPNFPKSKLVKKWYICEKYNCMDGLKKIVRLAVSVKFVYLQRATECSW
jgi:hypothetical protein